MSAFHLENYDSKLGLRVRVKTVDLDHAAEASSAQPGKIKRVTSIASLHSERKGGYRAIETPSSERVAKNQAEICMASGEPVTLADFESHIENCKVCGSRVELQLDFIATLEAAVYQRCGQPESEKIKGALLIGAPELNFAVCGELDFS